MSAAKPITNAQRRAAEKLLDEEARRLWTEFHQEFASNHYDRTRRDAEREWMDAHPEFVKHQKRAKAYVKKARKRLDEIAAEALAACPDLGSVHAFGVNAHTTGLTPSTLPDSGLMEPWHDRAQELRRQRQQRQQQVYDAILKRIEKGKRDILLATLGGVDKSLITLPSLAEIVKEVDA